MTGASNSEIDTFIQTAKERGVEDGALVALLKQNGWSERRIYRSLTAFYGKFLGIPAPVRSSSGDNARDAFLYLLNFITLGFWTIALGNLCYVLIAHAFPDRTTPNTPYAYGYGGGYSLMYQISWQLAAIIVAVPAFFVINRVIDHELARRPDLIESPIRLWLTYIALVIAATIVLIDGIWFLQALLRGELSIRFFLDSLVLLVLGGGVFAYYFAGLKPAQSDR
jgi:hypothetical protein